MRFSVCTFLAFVFGLATMTAGQSLSELARKEKERREKNKEKGEQVRVITEAELVQETSEGTSETSASDEASPATQSRTSARPRPRTSGVVEEQQSESTEEAEYTSDIELSQEASLRERIRLFELMKKGYQAEVKAIDEKIAKNNVRLAEIEQKLTSIGASGLPIAPQADRGTRHEGEFVALRNEQALLTKENSDLEAEKKAKDEELREKGRKAGIPPGYLRF